MVASPTLPAEAISLMVKVLEPKTSDGSGSNLLQMVTLQANNIHFVGSVNIFSFV